MNYLAHIFLSGSNRQIAVGNFIGDFVKGKGYDAFPPGIRDGILMHREIDHFTDTHPIFLESVELLKPTFGRYSGVMVDLYYDYILASNFKQYHKNGLSLTRFTHNFYLSTLLYYRWLPQNVKSFIFHFISTNRLKRYATYEGLQNTFEIMSLHKTSAINPLLSIEFLRENEEQLKEYFSSFISEAMQKFPKEM